MSRCTKCKCVHLRVKASGPVESFNYNIMIIKHEDDGFTGLLKSTNDLIYTETIK